VGLHALGIGTTSTWFARIDAVNHLYTGTEGASIFGADIPLNDDNDHFAEGTTYLGQELSMDPTLSSGTRKEWTAPEFGVLQDLGYVVVPEPTVVSLLGVAWAFCMTARRRR